MKHIKFTFNMLALTTILFAGCGDYLDVVPDNIVEVSKFYENKEKAYSGLATCYSYMPNFDNIDRSMVLAGDEYCERLDATIVRNVDVVRGVKIMREFQNANNPILSYWNGQGGVVSLYEGIRNCNIFLDYIDEVPDMTDVEKANWRSQVIFLKAFYHFYLLIHYGPIVISDGYVSASSSIEEVRQFRSTIDECFDYIVSTIDIAIPGLPVRRGLTELGMIDKIGAMAIKARVLLYAASPFYNGNNEYYSNFKNQEGVHYFNQTEDPQKWSLALEAAKAVVNELETAGKKLYEYDRDYYSFDLIDSETSQIMKPVYNCRFSVLDPWNDELLWGYSNQSRFDEGHLSHFANMRTLEEPTYTYVARQWLSANYTMTELFYSKNGVPINEDLTYDYENRLEVTEIPQDTYALGFLQEGEQTIKLHLNRESRFYAWLGTDRAYWRTHSVKNPLMMRVGEDPGGKTAITQFDFFQTGIAIKKLVHPESGAGNIVRVVKYPWPIIRVADIYLMIAEAENELNGPNPEAYEALNKVRRRAGLPDVETVWSNGAIVTEPGKHTDKIGFRRIIQHERLIELCFEGHRYYDLIRWKRAEEFFQLPVMGWDVNKSRTDFYTLGILQARNWQSPRDNLFPLPLYELTVNPNLIQNPGW